jgi:hypothetical protein
MDRVLGWLLQFGNTGAVANAGRLRDEHLREEWSVEALVNRLAATAARPASSARLAGAGRQDSHAA